jgi:serine/threonine protein kinase/tetratricopeptide (TPR) repeat protein
VSERQGDLDSLIESVADGREVDWDSARSGTGARERRLIEQLRLLARIGAFAKDEAPLSELAPGEEWGTFELLERLGRGACGEVWRARDLHLDREVALKLLPDIADGAPAGMVVHEGHLLSRVRHPNVVTVFGADRQDGRIGVWMEHIEGRTLADQLTADGPFEPQEAASVGVDLCRALAAVHSAGLVHRDVKAQNVMRDARGRTVLMDLGVGIDLHRPREGEAAAGTPLYLAPELFEGSAPSAASDLYSLGVLLFYLVSGSFPVWGATLDDVARAHSTGDRLPLRDVRPDLPDTFAAVVERALDRDPERRFSAREMEEALLSSEPVDVAPSEGRFGGRANWRLGLGGLGAVAVISGVLWLVAPDSSRGVPASTVPFAARDTVLIAAFENHTGDTSLNGALERALAHELSQSPHLIVASTQRIDYALRLMGKPIESKLDAGIAREVALRDGDIPLVLAGAAEKLGGTYVLTVQAIDPDEGAIRLSVREEAGSADTIVPALRRLASRIRTALGEDSGAVHSAMTRLQKVTTPSLQALRLFSEAHEAGTRLRWAESEALVRSALELEPEFPAALNWLAHCLRNLAAPREQWFPLFERAFALAPTTSDRERYFLVGSYYHVLPDAEAAIAAYRSLVRLYPDHAWGVNNLIMCLKAAGRHLEISDLLAELARARPLDRGLTVEAAMEILVARGTDAARPYVARAQSLAANAGPDMAYHSTWLELFPAHEHWLAGRPGEAATALRSTMAPDATVTASVDWHGYAAGWLHLALGQTKAAETAFSRVSDRQWRTTGLGLTALARGDAAAVRGHLSDYSGFDAFAVLLLLRAGASDAAERELDRIMATGPFRPDPAWDAIRAEVVAARTTPSESTVTMLERVVEELQVPWFTGRYYFHVETLSSLLLARGDTAGALRILEAASGTRDRVHKDPTHVGYLWMRVQVRLAELYRDLGRLDDAERIESDLLRLLEHADPDFAILRELDARRSAVAIR